MNFILFYCHQFIIFSGTLLEIITFVDATQWFEQDTA